MTDKDIKHSDRPKHHVIDKHTGLSVGSYFNKTRARNEVDKRDNEYGGYKHRLETRYPGDSPNPQTTSEISASLQERMGKK